MLGVEASLASEYAFWLARPSFVGARHEQTVMSIEGQARI